jgi:hypothetical protein
MNPDEALVKEIMNVLEIDVTKLHKIINQKGKLERKTVEEAFFLVQEIQMYLYKLFSIST